jgi:Protein of unknown function (DUF1214)
MRAGLSSFDKKTLKMTNDGAVDLYLGPGAPDGLESNWIPTEGKVPYPMLRFYGPLPPFWNKTFALPDIELVENWLPPAAARRQRFSSRRRERTEAALRYEGRPV